MVGPTRQVQLGTQPGIARNEAYGLAAEMNARFLQQLRALAPDDWRRVTICAPWTVKDIAAHLLGWAEALTSVRELTHQARAALPRLKEFGNIIDAQNQVQVDERATLSTEELIGRLELAMPRAARRRRRLGSLHYLPAFVPYLGGMINLGYVVNVIFLRDLLVHRIDVARATDGDPLLGSAEERVIADMLRDWSRRASAALVIDLTGPGGGSYVAGDGSGGRVEADAADFVHLLARRAEQDVADVHGNEERIRGWLAVPCPV